jgi:hypothetical protein
MKYKTLIEFAREQCELYQCCYRVRSQNPNSVHPLSKFESSKSGQVALNLTRSPCSSVCFKSWTTVWAYVSGCMWSHLFAIVCFGGEGRSVLGGWFLWGAIVGLSHRAINSKTRR